MAGRTKTAAAPTKGSEDLAPTEIAVEIPVVEEVEDPFGFTAKDVEEQVDPPEADHEDIPLFVPQMQVLICGSKTWDDVPKVTAALGELGKHYPGAGPNGLLIHGGNPGAERIAAQQWSRWGFHCTAEVPLWGQHGRSAGVRRNIKVIDDLDPATDIVIAFVKGEDKTVGRMTGYAASKGVRVVMITG